MAASKGIRHHRAHAGHHQLDSWQIYGIPKKEKTSLKVTHVAAKKRSIKKQRTSTNSTGLQKQVAVILDKIKVNGYDSLTDEEKEILFTASKK